TVAGIDVSGGRVAGVRTSGGGVAADAVVVAAGVHADRLLAGVGLELPLLPRHVSVVQTTPLPAMLDQVLGVANADFAGRQEVGGRSRFPGGPAPWRGPEQPLNDAPLQPPARDVARLIERGARLVPALAEARLARVWGGLLDATPDALPVIERPPELDG